MQLRRLTAHQFQDFLQRYEAGFDRTQQLVENDHVILALLHHVFGNLPAVRSRGRMVFHGNARITQTLDGEAAAGYLEVHPRQPAQYLTLTALPLTFDELKEENA